MQNIGRDPAAVIHVAVGVVCDQANRVLISRRAANVHQANLWEFPGGKLEPGESPEQALARELEEELGIQIQSSRPFIKINHDYGDKRVCLDVHVIECFNGAPEGKEGQPVKWISVKELRPEDFPAANYPIIQALKLPTVVQITGGFDSLETLLAKTKRVIGDGIRLVHFRAHQLNDATYIDYAREISELCHRSEVKLVLNRHPEILKDVTADGVHLSRHYLQTLKARPCTAEQLFSISCHNLNELKMAASLNVDYCFLSPVYRAISHHVEHVLGWEQFSTLLTQTNVAAYALGGMHSGQVDQAREHGGIGIAQISEYW